MRGRERFTAQDVDRALLAAQPFECGGERQQVPVAMTAINFRDRSIAIGARLVDVRLDLPDQRDAGRGVVSAARLADRSRSRVLLPAASAMSIASLRSAATMSNEIVSCRPP